MKGNKVFIPIMAVTFLIISSIGCDMVYDFNDVANPTNENVAVIGDSLFDFSGEVQEFLAELSGETYEDWTRTGEKIAGIAKQYDNAIYKNPNLRTIIMDGGANDILQGNENKCKSSSTLPPECEELLDYIVDVAEDMLDDMYVDGVDNVLYVGYYHLPNSKAGLSVAIDYGNTEFSHSCNSSRVNCHFVETQPHFEGHLSQYVKSDNIHPSRAGSEVIANLIWDVMVAENIEQNSDGGGDNGGGDNGGDDNGGDDDDNDDDNGSGCN